MRRLISLLLMGLASALLPADPVRAFDLPPVNLGATSFLDGAPPSGPGLYFQQYLQYYTADEFQDKDGDRALPPFVTKNDLDVWVSLTQLVYQSDQELLWGGKWGMNVIVPYVSIDLEMTPPLLRDNGSGLGDIVVGPFLQWDPVMGKSGPLFMHRIELQMLLPTGKYDDDKDLNPGSNFFSFNPYWAGTVFLTPKWTGSWRLHYLWNAENNDPNDVRAVDDSQAGQAVHANFASAYEVLPGQLRLGLNGYYLKQITASEVDGHDVSGRERVFAVGPGLLWHLSRDSHLFFNAYFETAAENRTEGERFTLRFVHHF
ncbi:MAG TPA: transporter [Desulfuromonadales bacterium]|nr:transporter [Desulfuromonadales bacterium]